MIGFVLLSYPVLSQRTVPDGYDLVISDDFDSINSVYWSRGLQDDTPGSDKGLIWNKNTGGTNLLNDNYAGYITDEDSYVENGVLFLRNQERVYQGTDPARPFNYTSGWINSCGKILFNGTKRGILIKFRAKFPLGTEVWPAIWLVTDAPHWPPEIDIWEYFGQFFASPNRKDEMALRYIYGVWTDPINVSHAIRPFNETYDISQWHEYGFEWTDEALIWNIDGKIIGTMTRDVADSGTWLNSVIPAEAWPNEDFALVLNNGIMSVLAGQGTIYPNYLNIDWLDIYQASVMQVNRNISGRNGTHVYPNPSSGSLNVEFNKPLENVVIDVYNATGQLQKCYVANDCTDLTINVSDLTRGIYILKVICDGTVERKRIMLN